MDWLYVLNYTIFAVFFALFALEGGIAITALFKYEKYRDKIIRYINPIWEVDGTFAVFYLVNFEASFPKLLSGLASLYTVPLLLAFFFLMVRNISIAYGGYLDDPKKEKKIVKFYGVATLVLLVIIISVLTSGIGGFGVNYGANTVNLIQVLVNQFNLLAIASILLFSLFVASTYFGFKSKKIKVLSVVFGLLLFAIGFLIYLPYLIPNLLSNLPALVIILLITLVAILYSLTEHKNAGVVAIFWLFASVLFFGLLEYPYLFGGTITITNYLNSTAIANGLLAISIIGGTVLVLSIAALVYFVYIKRKKGK